MTLTKPGTSGPLRYKYVGSGFWQRTQIGSSNSVGTFDAFTYGLPTASNSIVRRGGATYAVDLTGIATSRESLYTMRGDGELTANFLTGQITGGNSRQGGAKFIPIDSLRGVPYDGSWRLTAQMASEGNDVSGNIILNFRDGYRGAINGRFYGPNFEEVGLSFGAVYEDQAAVGAILGRKSKGSIRDINPSLADLQFDQTLSHGSIFYTDIRSDLANDGDLVFPWYNDSPFSDLDYRALDSAFILSRSVFPNSPKLEFLPSDIAPIQGDGKYILYEKQIGDETASLKLYKVGGNNPALVMTYASFAEYVRTAAVPGRPGYVKKDGILFPLAIATPSTGIPLTGTADYAGIIAGKGVAPGHTGLPVMILEGTANFSIDFARRSGTVRVAPVLLDPRDGSRHTFDPVTNSNFFSVPSTQPVGIPNPSVEFWAGNSGTGNSPNLSDTSVKVVFAGPQAEEMGGTFSSRYVVPGFSNVTGAMIGGVVAKRVP